MMKKFILLTLAVALFYSCQKDRLDPNEDYIKELLGENWRETTPYMTMTNTGNAYNPSQFIRLAGSGTAMISWGDKNPVEQIVLTDELSEIIVHTYSKQIRHTITIIGNNITHLYCGSILLSNLDVSKNRWLTELDCSFGEDLKNLDVSKNSALTYLDVTGTQITTLDVSKNADLKYLSFGGIDIASLDVSKNLVLTHLIGGNNKLSNLDVSKNIALTELTIFGGPSQNITKLDLSKNIALTKLNCYGNRLTELDLSKNIALTQLQCSSNQLTSLDMSNNSAINWVDCEVNNLQVDALNSLFNSLPVVEVGMIAIGRNPGATVAGVHTSIAEGKGWTFLH